MTSRGRRPAASWDGGAVSRVARGRVADARTATSHARVRRAGPGRAARRRTEAREEGGARSRRSRPRRLRRRRSRRRPISPAPWTASGDGRGLGDASGGRVGSRRAPPEAGGRRPSARLHRRPTSGAGENGSIGASGIPNAGGPFGPRSRGLAPPQSARRPDARRGDRGRAHGAAEASLASMGASTAVISVVSANGVAAMPGRSSPRRGRARSAAAAARSRGRAGTARRAPVRARGIVTPAPTLTCVTEPSFPGLEMRIAILVLI